MPKKVNAPPSKIPAKLPTTESVSWAQGLFLEFSELALRYHDLTKQSFALQARLELIEKNLCVARDHLKIAMDNTDEVLPKEWSTVIESTRFVGMRLADACLALLREKKRMTAVEMLNELNLGTFRFRTNSPAREIHGALLRQPYVKRLPDGWMWTGPDIVDAPASTQPTAIATLRLIAPTPNGGLNKGGKD